MPGSFCSLVFLCCVCIALASCMYAMCKMSSVILLYREVWILMQFFVFSWMHATHVLQMSPRDLFCDLEVA